jgi:hypothetical protein
MPREPQNGKKADKESGASGRDARLKAALRENLRRRKARARGRAGEAKSGAEASPEPAPSRENDR